MFSSIPKQNKIYKLPIANRLDEKLMNPTIQYIIHSI